MKRKLKCLTRRRPKVRVGIDELVEQVNEKTGFSKTDVKEIYKVISEVMLENLLQKKSVLVPNLGTLFPRIAPERIGMALNGGFVKGSSEAPKRVKVPARWHLRFLPTKSVKGLFVDLNVSEQEVEDLYED